MKSRDLPKEPRTHGPIFNFERMLLHNGIQNINSIFWFGLFGLIIKLKKAKQEHSE